MSEVFLLELIQNVIQRAENLNIREKGILLEYLLDVKDYGTFSGRVNENMYRPEFYDQNFTNFFENSTEIHGWVVQI